MEKTIQIDGKPVKFKTGASFARIFKSQFGYDILTVIMPVISETLQNIDSMLEDMNNIKPSDVGNALEGVYSLELIDIQNMIWSMAKLADKDIPEPILWEEQFDEFPVFDIMKELLEILIPSLVTKKKYLMIKNMITPKQK